MLFWCKNQQWHSCHKHTTQTGDYFMYTLHIANKNYSSWSLRPWILFRELHIPFSEYSHPFNEDHAKQQSEFAVFSPTSCVPVLEDGGTTIWDSLAIVEYAAEAFPAVWPEDKKARAWARSVCAEMHAGFSALRSECAMICSLQIDLHERSEALQADLARLDRLFGDGLSRFGGPFLAGNRFTAADAFFAPVVFRIRTYGLSLSELSSQYVQHMLALKNMRVWYEAALQEPARLPAYENKSGIGQIVQDYRN